MSGLRAEHQGHPESSQIDHFGVPASEHVESTKVALSWAVRTVQQGGWSFACCMDSSHGVGIGGSLRMHISNHVSKRLAEWTITKPEPTEAAPQNILRGVFFDKKRDSNNLDF